MERQNTIIIWAISVLIIIFFSVTVSPDFRHKIRQFIGDETSHYYHQTINVPSPDSIDIEILMHTIVKVNDNFLGYSKQNNGLIVLDSKNSDQYLNIYTHNCSSCH